jgi:hypothetical protein
LIAGKRRSSICKNSGLFLKIVWKAYDGHCGWVGLGWVGLGWWCDISMSVACLWRGVCQCQAKNGISSCWKVRMQLRPYTPENTGSRPISEVKQALAQSVLWWGTTREYCVLWFFFFLFFFFFCCWIISYYFAIGFQVIN